MRKQTKALVDDREHSVNMQGKFKRRDKKNTMCSISCRPPGDKFTLEVPVVIRLTCDCAVADDAVMPIRAESSS